jgi:hypothetical protein
MIHYKTDLISDAAMADYTVNVGDVLTLDMPTPDGTPVRGEHTVMEVEISDAGKHPESGEHLNRITLTLDDGRGV